LNYRRGSAPDVERRVRCEFVEMRGFSPTVQQAARLFQLNPDECGQLLTRLVQEGFLRQTPDGRFRLPS
jgi:DNA-binding IclR family transcriptional regulator